MQPVRAALPEFDRVWDHTVAAPEFGDGDLAVAELRFDFRDALVQGRAVGDDFALGRRPGGDLAAARARVEIGRSLFLRDALHLPFDAHLPLEHAPVKHQRGFARGR